LIYSIKEVDENEFLVGCQDGLWIVSSEKNYSELVFREKINEIPSTKVQCILFSKKDNGFFVGTEDEGLYFLKKNKGWKVTKLINDKKFDNINIQSLLIDRQNNLWVCTFGNGVLKLQYDSINKKFSNIIIYDQNNGVGDNYIKCAYQDYEGNIWFGTYTNGISAIIDEAFVFYNFRSESLNNDILALYQNNKDIWIGSRKAIYYAPNSDFSNKKVFTEKNGLPNDDFVSVTGEDDVLWIGTEHSGIYQYKDGVFKSFFKSENSLENKINKLILNNNILWAATNGGLFSFNLLNNQIKHYTTVNNLPHNKINDVFVDSYNNIWIATKSNGLYSVLSEKYLKMDGSIEIEFVGIAEDKEKNLWAISYGDGIFCFKKDTIIHLSEANGLKSDYLYSIITDNDGNLWVGQRMAISKINPATLKVMTYGIELGIRGDCNFRCVAKDKRGYLRFGTTDGMIQYNYRSDRSASIPPMLNFTSIKIMDKEYDIADKIILPYNKYRIRFEFVGLYYRSPGSVKYQYKLEGWETEWSDLTANNVVFYPRIEDGDFTFLVRAISDEGISTGQPLKINIIIQPPLWKRWWFILLSVFIIIALFYLYIKYRERKQILFQQYLQKMLDERTREVMEQKEEIELKNRDITDSITYAQRIQSSILPSVKKLQESFSGCFIFYQPRDIVSGDFYWFDKISDVKFIIVCADSTGHGVPGALMSMIGTTLVKDICNRPDVVTPSDVLQKLDEEMKATLHQNYEDAQSADGMDLIACEIDLQSFMVKIASAMRPVILYKNGEQIYVSGSKNSVGGIEYIHENKKFEDQVFQLSRGDYIYMFSDGYPDQFGGPMGKKFKMIRLRNLLKDIHELPMEEQYYQIKNTFNLWKGQLDQVDDVLFMGIRL